MALDINNKSLFLVTGAGRSGTSLVTRILQKLGVDPIGELTGPSIQNPEGAFENKFIFNTHRRIIKKSHLDVSSIITSGMVDKNRRTKAQKSILQYLDEVKKESDAIVIKDPALSFMMPIWRKIIKNYEAKPVIVIAIRDPSHILSSYISNYGISKYKAELIILHRLASSIKNSFGIGRVVNYDNWFNSNKEKQLKALVNLAKSYTSNIELDQKEVHNLIKDNLNRASEKPEKPENKDLIKLHEMLCKLKPCSIIPNDIIEFAGICLKKMEPFFQYEQEIQDNKKKIDQLENTITKLEKTIKSKQSSEIKVPAKPKKAPNNKNKRPKDGVSLEMKNILDALYISKTNKPYIYLNKPKSACTTTRRMLTRHEMPDHTAEEFDKLRKKTKNFRGKYLGNNRKSKYFSNDLDLYNSVKDSAFTFTIVRNPYSRIISCYRDKCYFPDGVPKGFTIMGTAKELGVGRKFVPLIEFLEYIEAQNDLERDHHWRTQHTLNLDDFARCDFIGSLENINQDLGYVIKKIFGKQKYKIDNKNSHSSRISTEELAGEKELKLIYNIYKKDFERFGYSTDFADYKLPPKKPNLNAA